MREPKEGPTDVALFIGGIPCHPSYDHSALIAIPAMRTRELDGHGGANESATYNRHLGTFRRDFPPSL
jgi:hypothetical protein